MNLRLERSTFIWFSIIVFFRPVSFSAQLSLLKSEFFKRGKDATICHLHCVLNINFVRTETARNDRYSRNDRKIWTVGQPKRPESLNSRTAETTGKSEQSDSRNDRKVWTVGQPKRPVSLISRTAETAGKSEQSDNRNSRKVWTVADSRNDRKVWTVGQPKLPESLNSRTAETAGKSEQSDSRNNRKVWTTNMNEWMKERQTVAPGVQ